jgi:hypothetical protein
MSTVATVGMIVVGGRWAHRLALVSLGFETVLAIVRPVDFVWVVSVALTGMALASLLSAPLRRTIRRLPSASGPPPRAITPPLLLLAAPCVLGLLGNEAEPWALLVVGVSAPGVALLYSRVIPGGLLAIRLFWPVTALALSPLLGWPAGIASVALAVTVAAFAWGESVRVSYHPPREVGTTFPIPPELTPSEILEAAEIDESGRPK